MKSKFKYLIEAGIVNAPSALGSKQTYNNVPFETNQNAINQTGAWGNVTPAPTPAPVVSVPVITSAPAPITHSITPTVSEPTSINNNPNPFTVAPRSPTPPATSAATSSPTKTSAETPAATSAPSRTLIKSEPAVKSKTPTQYDVNKAASDAEFEKFKAFQQRKQQRAGILAQTKQAEAEAAAGEPQARTGGDMQGRSSSGGTGTSGRRVFENHNRMQFKPDALKSLLDLQEAGIVDAISSGASAAWDWAKQNIPYVKTTSDKVKSVASDAWKYSTNPASAAKTMIKYTTPTPGESEAVRGIKTLIGYSPDTIARMQARRGAAASAFDTATANEKLKHYEKMFAISNPASLVTGAIKAGTSALAGSADAMGIGGKLATGIAGAAKDIADYQVKAQAKEAARQKFAREDDWRVLTR
jgi:hypothetical protein